MGYHGVPSTRSQLLCAICCGYRSEEFHGRIGFHLVAFVAVVGISSRGEDASEAEEEFSKSEDDGESSSWPNAGSFDHEGLTG